MSRPQPNSSSRATKKSVKKGSVNGQRVIGIPELFILIVHELDAKQQRELMAVSKNFFRSIGPIAWRKVPRLDILMKLIKNMRVKTTDLGGRADYKWQFVSCPPGLL
jgi:hypothetical protein